LPSPLTVVGRHGGPLPIRGEAPAHGHGWPSAALTTYRLASGHAPAGPGEVVLDAGLVRAGGFDVGDRVRVVSPAGADTFRLAGVAGASPAQQERQSSVFVTQARAQELSGLGAGFNAIAVRAEPGVDGGLLRERIGDAVGGDPQVLDHRHAATADAGDPRAFDRVELVALLAAGGGITLAITIFVVAGTIAFGVERRRRELALLRAVGATPGQVRRLLAGETALIGLVAGAAGSVAATALFAPFSDSLVSVGSRLMASRSRRTGSRTRSRSRSGWSSRRSRPSSRAAARSPCPRARRSSSRRCRSGGWVSCVRCSASSHSAAASRS
jgi:putative ABC transport system permease protein